MSISERDAILRERKAFERGVFAMHLQPEVPSGEAGARARERAASEVSARYPLPKVKRVRVVEDEDGDEWRWTVSMGLQVRVRGREWENGGYHITTPRQIEVVRDVLADPWVEVEE